MRERLGEAVAILGLVALIGVLAGLWFVFSKLPSWVFPALGWVIVIGIAIAILGGSAWLVLKVAMHFKIVFLTPAISHMFNKGQGLVSYHKGEFREFDPPAIGPAKEMVVRHIPAEISAMRHELPPPEEVEVEEVQEEQPQRALPSPSYDGDDTGDWILNQARMAFDNGARSRRTLAAEIGVTTDRASKLLAVIKNERR